MIGTLVDPYFKRIDVLHRAGRRSKEHDAAPHTPGREMLELGVPNSRGWVYEANGVASSRVSEYARAVRGWTDCRDDSDRRRTFDALFDAGDVGVLGVLRQVRRIWAEIGWHRRSSRPRKMSKRGWATGGSTRPGGKFLHAKRRSGDFHMRGGRAVFGRRRGISDDRTWILTVLGKELHKRECRWALVFFTSEILTKDRVRVSVMHNVVRFLVPNELCSQRAGQRQDIQNLRHADQITSSTTISAEIVYEQLFGSVRDSRDNAGVQTRGTPVLSFRVVPSLGSIPPMNRHHGGHQLIP